jgi:hypothetical protein
MSSSEEKTKRWRPWQFSLRFLMLLTFGAASFFGGWQANEFSRRSNLPTPTQSTTVKVIPISNQQRLRKMIDDQKVLDRWEMLEQQKRNSSQLQFW